MQLIKTGFQENIQQKKFEFITNIFQEKNIKYFSTYFKTLNYMFVPENQLDPKILKL